jgi:N-acyl-D-aspartate/D-glutamate deacylase
MATIDLVIRGGKVVDGSGNPWFYGDVALSGERIEAITPPGTIPPEAAGEVVDASGMVVCPGFIDILSHSIVPLMSDPRCLSKVTQGVTTEIMGELWTPAPFGGRMQSPIVESAIQASFLTDAMRARIAGWEERALGWQRFGDWLTTMEQRGVAPNVGAFVGGGTVREYAMGMEMGPANPDEVQIMRRVVAEAMEDGAFGVAYALIYPPCAFVETDELVAVCQEVSRHGGIYVTHMRSEGARLEEAVEESIEIGRRANIPIEIYHLKAAGKDNWPKMQHVVGRIDAARASGIDIGADIYPYTGAGTGLDAVLPPWLAAEGRFFDNLRDPTLLARARREAHHPTGDWEALASQNGPEAVMPVGLQRPEHKPYIGKRLSEIAAMRGQDWFDTVVDLLLAEHQRIGTIYFSMREGNVLLALQQPWIKIGTDAGGLAPKWAVEDGPTHPRAYGSYPRILGQYVREEDVLPLEDAIRKMSAAVANRVGLRDRGQLRRGFYADVVIFDPATIADHATYGDSHQLSTGVRDVWVNGTRVLADSIHTNATPGRFVTRS